MKKNVEKCFDILYASQSAQLISALLIVAGDLGFDYRAGQIEHRVANGLPPLRCSSELCWPGAKSRRRAPPFVIRCGVIPECIENMLFFDLSQGSNG